MIQALKADPKAQEKLVRRELGWVRENEIVLESVDKETEGGENAAGLIKPFSLPNNPIAQVISSPDSQPGQAGNQKGHEGLEGDTKTTKKSITRKAKSLLPCP